MLKTYTGSCHPARFALRLISISAPAPGNATAPFAPRAGIGQRPSNPKPFACSRAKRHSVTISLLRRAHTISSAGTAVSGPLDAAISSRSGATMCRSSLLRSTMRRPKNSLPHRSSTPMVGTTAGGQNPPKLAICECAAGRDQASNRVVSIVPNDESSRGAIARGTGRQPTRQPRR
jgi:hypothetical protein